MAPPRPRKLKHLQEKNTPPLKLKQHPFLLSVLPAIVIAIIIGFVSVRFSSDRLQQESSPPPWSSHPVRSENLPCHDLSSFSSFDPVARMTQAQYDVVNANARLCSPIVIIDALNKWEALLKWDKYFFQEYYGEERGAATGKFNDDAPETFAMPLRMFAEHSHEGTPTTWSYLQDELFISSHPELLEDLSPTPQPLLHSWFRYLPPILQPPDAFLLWGTAHSRSTLHIDPYNWTGTNALIRGTKDWIFVPPGNDHWIYPIEGSTRCGFPLDCYKYNSRVNAFAPDALEQFPLFANATVIRTTQHEGELMIIPPGWYHQVQNPSESIAIASQIWSDDSFEVSMDEIVKYTGNLAEDGGMPSKNERASLTREQQFQALLDAIPTRVEREAEATLRDALDQINNLNQKKKSISGKKT
jgi:hypothetical protein